MQNFSAHILLHSDSFLHRSSLCGLDKPDIGPGDNNEPARNSNRSNGPSNHGHDYMANNGSNNNETESSESN